MTGSSGGRRFSFPTAEGVSEEVRRHPSASGLGGRAPVEPAVPILGVFGPETPGPGVAAGERVGRLIPGVGVVSAIDAVEVESVEPGRNGGGYAGGGDHKEGHGSGRRAHHTGQGIKSALLKEGHGRFAWPSGFATTVAQRGGQAASPHFRLLSPSVMSNSRKRNPDRGQVPRSVQTRQLHRIPAVRFHPLPGGPGNPARRHDRAVMSGLHDLAKHAISARTRFMAKLMAAPSGLSFLISRRSDLRRLENSPR